MFRDIKERKGTSSRQIKRSVESQAVLRRELEWRAAQMQGGGGHWCAEGLSQFHWFRQVTLS